MQAVKKVIDRISLMRCSSTVIDLKSSKCVKHKSRVDFLRVGSTLII